MSSRPTFLANLISWRNRRLKSGTDVPSDDASEEQVELHTNEVTDGAVILGLDNDEDNNQESNKRYLPSIYSLKGRRGLSALAMLSSHEYQFQDPVAIAIFKSIHQGNIGELFVLLDEDIEDRINKLRVVGQSILHLICLKEDLGALQIVLALKANIDAINADGVTALHLAVCQGWSDGVKELLSNGSKTDILPIVGNGSAWPWQEYPIHTACRNGDYAVAKQLLKCKPFLSFPNFDGYLVLHLAAYSHNFDLIQLLLEEKIVKESISIQNDNGNTALHMIMLAENASSFEEEIVECVKLLLQQGPEINTVNSSGKSALLLAARANLPLVVETLLASRANPLLIDNDGRNVLHAACAAGSHESLSLLLLHNDKVKQLVRKTDKEKLSPFHFAVSKCSITCCEILLQNGDHLTNVDNIGQTRCALVLRNMPSAIQLFKKMFDNHVIISDNDIDDHAFKIEMDFSVLLSKSTNNIEASLISNFKSSSTESLLKHPLIESFLYLKWNKIKLFFFCYVIAYSIFLVIHTYYVISTFNMKTDWSKHPVSLDIIYWLHATLLIALVLPGVIIMFANAKEYMKQWETYFKIFALFAASFVIFTQGSTFFSEQVSRSVASTSIFFTWVEFMMLLGRLPFLGVYILMFTKVAKSVLLFLLAFSPLFLAFAFSFSIILNHAEPFDSFPGVFVRTLMMMTGEIDFTDIYSSAKEEGQINLVVSQIFLVAFVILIPILMTNLLIGLAVSDLPDLKLQGKIRRLVKEASYLESYEKLMLFFREVSPMPSMVTNVLSGKGAIPRKISIWPNQGNRKDSVKIPSDALEEAKVSGTKKNVSTPFDLESVIKNFYFEYQKDRAHMEQAMETLYETIIYQLDQPRPIEDTVDGKGSKGKLTNKLFNRKGRRLHFFK